MDTMARRDALETVKEKGNRKRSVGQAVSSRLPLRTAKFNCLFDTVSFVGWSFATVVFVRGFVKFESVLGLQFMRFSFAFLSLK